MGPGFSNLWLGAVLLTHARQVKGLVCGCSGFLSPTAYLAALGCVRVQAFTPADWWSLDLFDRYRQVGIVVASTVS